MAQARQRPVTLCAALKLNNTETGDTSDPNQTTLCITHTNSIWRSGQHVHRRILCQQLDYRQAPSALYTFPSDLASQLRGDADGRRRTSAGGLIEDRAGRPEMNDDPESDGTTPRKRLKAISGADTDCGRWHHCNTRRGGETTRRPAHAQQASRRRLQKKKEELQFTSAQLLARAQDINLREELVERLWAQTQRNQLEMQALALQLDQERAGYLNQLANKEDEVQMQEQQISKFERILERVVGNESESSKVHQTVAHRRREVPRRRHVNLWEILLAPAIDIGKTFSTTKQSKQDKTANPPLTFTAKNVLEAVLNRRIPNETGVLVREAGFRPPIHPPIQPALRNPAGRRHRQSFAVQGEVQDQCIPDKTVTAFGAQAFGFTFLTSLNGAGARMKPRFGAATRRVIFSIRGIVGKSVDVREASCSLTFSFAHSWISNTDPQLPFTITQLSSTNCIVRVKLSTCINA
ncbi:hypothetical protein IMY05_C2453000200 [Salix suchowensis]|nr:hypothetical protein IMY05_C2453000200 [Salix suchowensis]